MSLCFQVPESDEGGRSVCGQSVQPVCVSTRWERHGAEGHTCHPPQLPAAPQHDQEPVLFIAYSGLLHKGTTGNMILKTGKTYSTIQCFSNVCWGCIRYIDISNKTLDVNLCYFKVHIIDCEDFRDQHCFFPTVFFDTMEFEFYDHRIWL